MLFSYDKLHHVLKGLGLWWWWWWGAQGIKKLSFFSSEEHEITAWPHMLLYNNHCDRVKISGGKLAPVRCNIMSWTVLWRTVMYGNVCWRVEGEPSVASFAAPLFSLEFWPSLNSFPLICFPITAHAISYFIDRLGMNVHFKAPIFISVSPSLFLFRSLSKDNIRGHKLFESNSFYPCGTSPE